MAGKKRKQKKQRKNKGGVGGGGMLRTMTIPIVVHDVIKAPTTTVRPTQVVKRDFPVMLPKSKFFYTKTVSDPTYPVKIKAPSKFTQIEPAKRTVNTTAIDKRTRIMNEYTRRVTLGEQLTLSDYVDRESCGGPEVRRQYIHRDDLDIDILK